MTNYPKLWICPICSKTKKAQGRGAHLRLAHELVIKKITDEELKFALGGNISLFGPELKSKLKLNSCKHKSNISPQFPETSENTKVSRDNISSRNLNPTQVKPSEQISDSLQVRHIEPAQVSNKYEHQYKCGRWGCEYKTDECNTLHEVSNPENVPGVTRPFLIVCEKCFEEMATIYDKYNRSQKDTNYKARYDEMSIEERQRAPKWMQRQNDNIPKQREIQMLAKGGIVNSSESEHKSYCGHCYNVELIQHKWHENVKYCPKCHMNYV
jgi:hypothetical protein